MINKFSELPTKEIEKIEFKSSKCTPNELGNKLCKAASAFSNSGGGVFVAGVDDYGNADGGYEEKFGRESVYDWIDKKLSFVSPATSYKVKLLQDCGSRGFIDKDKAIIVVEFELSEIAPHMAPDNKYYIRAGTHTEPASHYLVEALWARRAYRKPILTYKLKEKADDREIVLLAIVPLTSEPAIDITLNLDPIGDVFRQVGADKSFPLKINIIDRENPFEMEITLKRQFVELFGSNVSLLVKYHDILGNQYLLEGIIDGPEGLSPIKINPPR